jgi:PHD/YefM family antitoxin component YafN of YafNO toxin-antitoxin module
MKKRLTVSEARAKLFDLVEYVTDTPDAAVVIEHRNRKGRAVLVDESHYQYLEAMASEIKKQAKPFRLVGSIESDLSADELEEAMEENRREQARLAEEKFRDL